MKKTKTTILFFTHTVIIAAALNPIHPFSERFALVSPARKTQSALIG